MTVRVLGLSPDAATAALVEDGRLVAVVRTRGADGLAALLRETSLVVSQIDLLAVPAFAPLAEARRAASALRRDLRSALEGAGGALPGLSAAVALVRQRGRGLVASRARAAALAGPLEAFRGEERVRRVEPILALQVAGWAGCEARRALVVALDAPAGGLSGAISIATEAGLERLASLSAGQALTTLTDAAAAALGHGEPAPERLLAGLAGHGDPHVLLDRVASRLGVEAGTLRVTPPGRLFTELAERYTPPEVAAAWQMAVSDALGAVVGHFVERHETPDVVLCGRVFGDPRLVQRLATLPGLARVAVEPFAPDVALAAGSALWVYRQAASRHLQRPLVAPAGPSALDEASLAEAIARAGLTSERPANPARAAAERLAHGEVVARLEGGPWLAARDAGERSVLFSAEAGDAATWLGTRLGRPAGRPYGCLVRREDLPRCAEGPASAFEAARHGSTTLVARAAFRHEHPAVVHVDGTFLPTTVDADTRPELHALLSSLADQTGRLAVGHTALRLPGEPPVTSLDEALRAHALGHFDALLAGPLIVGRPGTL